MNDANCLLVAERLQVGRRTVLLADVDLCVQAGEAWFVLGRNGSGKSTLVATLLGLLRPLGGRVQRAAAIAGGAGLGYVPQEQRFEPPLPCTVAEFVALGLEDGGPAAQVLACVAHALEQLSAGELAGRRVQTLSLGQRRRVLAARALARRPRLLVLDEPTANLDTTAAAALAADVDRLRREQGLGIVQVGHDLGLARRHATHVALVDASRVLTGSAAAMFAAPQLRAAFAEALS